MARPQAGEAQSRLEGAAQPRERNGVERSDGSAEGRWSAATAKQGDERGLTVYDKWRGRQMLCHVCHGRPCADSCPEQWLPDRLEWKAARAGLPIEEWARMHGDWIDAHAQRPDVAAWLEGQTVASDARRIPVEGAMAQAMAVMAGEVRAQDAVPLYTHTARRAQDEDEGRTMWAR